jgi:hypothetical protein
VRIRGCEIAEKQRRKRDEKAAFGTRNGRIVAVKKQINFRVEFVVFE